MCTATKSVPPLHFGKYSPCDFLSSFVALSVENTPAATHATSTMTTLLLWMRKNRGKKFCLIFSFVFAFWTWKCDECIASEFSFQKQHLHAKESFHSNLRFLSSIGVFLFDWACPFSIYCKLTIPLPRVSIVLSLERSALYFAEETFAFTAKKKVQWTKRNTL